MTFQTMRSFGIAALSAVTIFAFAPGEASAQSRGECDAYARDWANRHTNTGGNVVSGAIGGAVIGGIIGGATGGGKRIGQGAAIGGGVGAATGLGGSSVAWDRNYRRAFRRCMDGENVRYREEPRRQAPRRGGRYEPWSPAWYDYCEQRYRSFNPQTGYFTTYGGEKRFCQ